MAGVSSTAGKLTWKIHHAEALSFLREQPDESVDALITDPPYSSGGRTMGERQADTTSKYVHHGVVQKHPDFRGDNRDQRSWAYWMALWLSEAWRVVRHGGYALVFSDWRQLPSATDSLQAGGFLWRGIVAWDKGGGARAPHTGYFRHQAEYVVWGTKGQCRRSDSGPYPGVYQVTVRPSDKFHIAGKPTELMAELARPVRGGVVLDPFAGSGSTGVGALRVGCTFLGAECERHNVDLARRRLEQEAQRLEEGPR